MAAAHLAEIKAAGMLRVLHKARTGPD